MNRGGWPPATIRYLSAYRHIKPLSCELFRSFYVTLVSKSAFLFSLGLPAEINSMLQITTQVLETPKITVSRINT